SFPPHRTHGATQDPPMTTYRTVLAAAALTLLPVAGLAATAPTAPTAPSAKAGSATTAAAAAARPKVFAFIQDDYGKAVTEARAHKVPIFVDAGAPWCHTCRSMDAFVFTDERLKKNNGRFVWLAINTENRKNAAFLQKNK